MCSVFLNSKNNKLNRIAFGDAGSATRMMETYTGGMNNVDSFTCYSFFMDSEKISIISVADPVSALADPVIYLLKATINNAYVVSFSTQKTTN